MKLKTLLLAAILAVLVVAVAPIWPHSAHWGYYPSRGIGILLVVVLLFAVLQRA